MADGYDTARETLDRVRRIETRLTKIANPPYSPDHRKMSIY